MRFLIHQSDLKPMLDHVGSIIGRKADPATQATLLTVTGNMLEASVHADGNVSRMRHTVDEPEPGRVLVNHRILTATVAQLPRVDVEAKVRDRDLILTAGSVRARIRLMDPTIWVEPLPVDETGLTPVDPDRWARRVRQAATTADRGQARNPVLETVRIIRDDRGLTLRATDRYRLSDARIPLAEPGPGFDILAPAADLPAPHTGNLRIGVADGRLIIHGDDVEDTRLTIDRQAPDLTRLLAEASDMTSHATFDRGELSDAIRRLDALAGLEGAGLRRVRMQAVDGTVRLSADGGDNGCVETLQPSDCPPAMDVTVNPSLLSTILDALDGMDARLRFTPGITRMFVDDPADPDVTFMLTLMRDPDGPQA